MRLERRHIVRIAMLAGAAVLADVALPRIFDAGSSAPVPRWFGQRAGNSLRFDHVRTGDVLESLAQHTGFRAVAFPAISGRPFSGSIDIGNGGEAAARDLARQAGLELRKGGPHWVMLPRQEDAAH